LSLIVLVLRALCIYYHFYSFEFFQNTNVICP